MSEREHFPSVLCIRARSSDHLTFLPPFRQVFPSLLRLLLGVSFFRLQFHRMFCVVGCLGFGLVLCFADRARLFLFGRCGVGCPQRGLLPRAVREVPVSRTGNLARAGFDRAVPTFRFWLLTPPPGGTQARRGSVDRSIRDSY